MKLENVVRVEESEGIPLGNYQGTWVGDTVTFETENGLVYQGKTKSPCDCIVVVSASGIGVIASSDIKPQQTIGQKLLRAKKKKSEATEVWVAAPMAESNEAKE